MLLVNHLADGGRWKGFQTKLTYGMICYLNSFIYSFGYCFMFQTKLTYGMICYSDSVSSGIGGLCEFQTKLTYGMICYDKAEEEAAAYKSFKLS